MLEQNVVVVIGPRSSSDVRAVHPICAGLHIPQIVPLATDPTINNLDNPYLLRVCFALQQECNRSKAHHPFRGRNPNTYNLILK